MILFLMLLHSHRHFVAGSAPQPSLRHSPLPHPQRRRRSWSRCFDFLPVCRLTDIRRRVRVRSALLTRSLYRSLLLAALSPFLSLSPCLAQVRFAIKTGRVNSPRQSGSVLSSPHGQQHGAAQKRDSKLWLAQQAAGMQGSKQAGNMLALSLPLSLAHSLTRSVDKPPPLPMTKWQNCCCCCRCCCRCCWGSDAGVVGFVPMASCRCV